MRIITTAAPLISTRGLRLAHAPMPGVRTILDHVLGETAPSLTELIPIAAHRIPQLLVDEEADAGVWWDSSTPPDFDGSVLAVSDLVVVANHQASLPTRPLRPSDLHDLTLVGFGGLGHRLLESFCRRMASNDAIVRFGNPNRHPSELDNPAFTLVPGANDAVAADDDCVVLPLADAIQARLILATSPNRTDFAA